MVPSSSFLLNFALPLALGICLRSSTILHPHSGMGTPPMYGDYEAQRHWMEITVNLPSTEWYCNTTSNDLQYWGLDYPPLTAYHSYLLGRISRLINPAWTELHTSRGIETPEHKQFMRLTVLFSDVFSFMLAALLFCGVAAKHLASKVELSGLSVAVLMMSFPGLILVDHGHFQYNCVSLGLFLASVVLFSRNFDVCGGIAFCLAILYKQMELYHSLPIFFFLLSKCLRQSLTAGLTHLSILGTAVCSTFTLVLLPFLTPVDQLKQLGARVFPVNRGLFEDKVATFWCVSSVLFKWKDLIPASGILIYCFAATLFASLPACILLFKRPTLLRLVLTEAIVSLAFFLFSYHVHEKSILLVAIPVLCLLPVFPLSSIYFLIVSTLSMWELFQKDDLSLACIALVSIFHAISAICLATDSAAKVKVSLIHFWPQTVSLLGFFIIFISEALIRPPDRYPFLFPLILSAYSFVHFVGFSVFWYTQLLQLE
ncbi:unnamed protein product [Mesocestoides corti]|uniref:Alpha-1,3-glucosyltransferase n=1 Tax=Mesocestoides corti TaxID=53468 RepID=A0A0R3UFA5_MESCO|nr:unnamed protein product [Mesocestoides corti]